MQSIQLPIRPIIMMALSLSVFVSSSANGQSFDQINLNLPNLFNGTSDWGDYDLDGDLDILISGFTPGRGNYIGLFQNEGRDNLIPVNISIPAVSSGSVTWGDYNNDGLLDIMVIGYVSPEGIMRIYENDGNGAFFDIGADLAAVYKGSGVWGDYDNDGDLDILFSGSDSVEFMVTGIYRNDGDDSFAYLELERRRLSIRNLFPQNSGRRVYRNQENVAFEIDSVVFKLFINRFNGANNRDAGLFALNRLYS